MTPTVSVVLNCYNHEPYVAAAIESVLAQTCRDFELILIDNGSTDGSRRVMQSFDDERIRLILHDDNQSISRRLNEGVAAARGQFVSILYSDDLFLPHKLERQLAIFSGRRCSAIERLSPGHSGRRSARAGRADPIISSGSSRQICSR